VPKRKPAAAKKPARKAAVKRPSRGSTERKAGAKATRVGRDSGGRLRPARILSLRRTITADAVREGLPVAVVDKLGGRLGMSTAKTLAMLNLPKQTFNRRRRAGRLSADESDRVVRYAELLARSVDLLGDEDAAAQWLNTAAPALHNETPLARATTEIGAREVLALIGRLEHGIPA
jgi:putative toxin-antitoxin system antitoxin component (TIGR02293 family)